MSLFRLALSCLLLALPATVARAQASLTAAEVDRIIGQATQEAAARGAPAIIAVTDRVGNVLGVYEMTGAPSTIAIGSQRIPGAGLQGLENVPTGIIDTELGAIAKAVTGAYLSSAGHAFTTRTASQIVQQFFNVEESGQPGGPLFGVQFSSLPCSDFVISNAAQTIGPKRTPLGLSADPGGFPLYKNGLVVGGIGVISDGQYGLDLRIRDFDRPNDELIALAGQFGFEPPAEILAFRLTVEGKTLRYSDVGFGHLTSNPATAGGPTGGAYITVTNYTTAAAAVAGTAYGDAASGFRADAANLYNVSPTPFIVVDNGNANRYAPKAGAAGVMADGTPSAQFLAAPEVTQIMTSALQIAYAGRAQIRRPLRSFIQVSIAVTDTTGDILAFARTPDAPIFGADVSVQKARSAAFISDPRAAARLSSPTCSGTGAGACLESQMAGTLIPVPPLNSYVTATRNFFNNPTMLANGIAFGARSIGNLHRPFFPDGYVSGDNGPLSTNYSVWSPFNVGFQLDLVIDNVVTNAVNAAHPAAAAPFCTPLDAQVWGGTALANGLQIFAGGVPIYKNGDLVGAIGVSGDGIDQDDMISLLGVHNAGVILGSGVGNAPNGLRANNLSPKGARLRYVSCPFAPFNDSRDQDPCGGK